MIPDYSIAEGDTLPVMVCEEFEDANGDPLSLAEDDEVFLRIQRSGGRDEPEDLECNITQRDPAVAESPAMNALVAGRYEARFVVKFAEGGQLSWPNGDTPIYVRVNKNAAPEAES